MANEIICIISSNLRSRRVVKLLSTCKSLRNEIKLVNEKLKNKLVFDIQCRNIEYIMVLLKEDLLNCYKDIKNFYCT